MSSDRDVGCYGLENFRKISRIITGAVVVRFYALAFHLLTEMSELFQALFAGFVRFYPIANLNAFLNSVMQLGLFLSASAIASS